MNSCIKVIVHASHHTEISIRTKIIIKNWSLCENWSIDCNHHIIWFCRFSKAAEKPQSSIQWTVYVLNTSSWNIQKATLHCIAYFAMHGDDFNSFWILTIATVLTIYCSISIDTAYATSLCFFHIWCLHNLFWISWSFFSFTLRSNLFFVLKSSSIIQ